MQKQGPEARQMKECIQEEVIGMETWRGLFKLDVDILCALYIQACTLHLCIVYFPFQMLLESDRTSHSRPFSNKELWPPDGKCHTGSTAWLRRTKRSGQHEFCGRGVSSFLTIARQLKHSDRGIVIYSQT